MPTHRIGMAVCGLPREARGVAYTIQQMRSFLIFLAFLLVATEAHAQWDIEESHTTASLRGIHNVGGGVVWASGTHGTVLRSEDGGYLWQSCNMPPGAEKLDFRGIQGWDENTAIVMSSGAGDQSRLYKTTDGCQSWKLVFTNPDKDGFWDAIVFADRKKGFLLGDPVGGVFVLMGTNDGGDHWTRSTVKELTSPGPQNGAFAASNSSLILSGPPSFATGGPDGAFFYRGDDVCTMGIHQEDPAQCIRNGLSFERAKLPLNGESKSSGAFSLARSDSRILAVGGDYTKPDQGSGTAAYLDTHVGGWQLSSSNPMGYRSAVAYDPDQKLWITVGPNGTDISIDDGKSWRPLKPSPTDAPDADKNWNALSLPFVVGPHGRIGRLRTISNASK
jgi:hypothetical protein